MEVLKQSGIFLYSFTNQAHSQVFDGLKEILQEQGENQWERPTSFHAIDWHFEHIFEWCNRLQLQWWNDQYQIYRKREKFWKWLNKFTENRDSMIARLFQGDLFLSINALLLIRTSKFCFG